MTGRTPEDVVRSLFASLTSEPGDLDAVLAHFAPEASYWMNAWRQPHTGIDAIRAELVRQDAEYDGLTSELVSVVAAGDTVFTQRLDSMTIGGKPITLHFAGQFVVDAQSRIVEWRDWFDSAEVAELMKVST